MQRITPALSQQRQPTWSRTAACLLALAGALATDARAQAASVDLTTSQTVLGPVSPGGTASVRITVTNLGTLTATNFYVIGGVVNAALNTVGGATATCAKGRNSVYTCLLPALGPGASTDLLLTARVDSTAATFTSNTQSSGGGDVNFANNASQVSAPVLAPPPDVQISGSASTNSPAAGAVYSYRFQIKVGGSAPADNVGFSALMPAELTLLSAVTSNGSACTLNAGNLSCLIGSMPAGGGADVTLSVQAPPLARTAASLTGVALAGDGRDANLSNNSKTIDISTR